MQGILKAFPKLQLLEKNQILFEYISNTRNIRIYNYDYFDMAGRA